MEAKAVSQNSPKLLDQIRVRHYSIRTEEVYVDWARRFILFHNKRHPKEMGAEEVRDFLSHLAVERNVAASTQNQAKSALLFLYREVLHIELPWLEEVVVAKTPKRLPVVLTQTETRRLLNSMSGTMGLVASLLYGTGMRLLECLRLRVKDVEFERREIIVREGKGNKDRVTVLPENLILPLKAHLVKVKALHVWILPVMGITMSGLIWEFPKTLLNRKNSFMKSYIIYPQKKGAGSKFSVINY